MPNSNRDKGLKSERDVAAYFRVNGCASAERSVSTGWSNGARQLADCGDIKGVPGVCIQIKNLAAPLTGQALSNALKETEGQRTAGGAAIGLLVEKRHQCADVGQWFAWLLNTAYIGLMVGRSPHGLVAEHPVRVELRHIIDQLIKFSAVAARHGYR
ncbi:MAG: hypothetical protein ACRDRO_11790 [Pseudonocardiaceae bacterium]